MANTQFNELTLTQDDLVVRGPFRAGAADGELVGDVTIRFVLVQRPENVGDRPVIVNGTTSWRPGLSEWRTKIPRSELAGVLRPTPTSTTQGPPDEDDLVRAVGVAIVV